MNKIEIYEFQLKDIYEALRLTDNIYKCSIQDTAFKRQVIIAKKYAENALGGNIDKREQYGISK